MLLLFFLAPVLLIALLITLPFLGIAMAIAISAAAFGQIIIYYYDKIMEWER